VGENTDRSSQSEVLEEEKEDAKGADFLRGRGRGLILRHLHPCHLGMQLGGRHATDTIDYTFKLHYKEIIRSRILSHSED
jgi:hypothetical protein